MWAFWKFTHVKKTFTGFVQEFHMGTKYWVCVFRVISQLSSHICEESWLTKSEFSGIRLRLIPCQNLHILTAEYASHGSLRHWYSACFGCVQCEVVTTYVSDPPAVSRGEHMATGSRAVPRAASGRVATLLRRRQQQAARVQKQHAHARRRD